MLDSVEAQKEGSMVSTYIERTCDLGLFLAMSLVVQRMVEVGRRIKSEELREIVVEVENGTKA